MVRAQVEEAPASSSLLEEVEGPMGTSKVMKVMIGAPNMLLKYTYADTYNKYCVYIYVYSICMYVWMDGWMDGWMYVCMYMFLIQIYTEIYVYIYMYKHSSGSVCHFTVTLRFCSWLLYSDLCFMYPICGNLLGGLVNVTRSGVIVEVSLLQNQTCSAVIMLMSQYYMGHQLFSAISLVSNQGTRTMNWSIPIFSCHQMMYCGSRCCHRRRPASPVSSGNLGSYKMRSKLCITLSLGDFFPDLCGDASRPIINKSDSVGIYIRYVYIHTYIYIYM